jgi:hypothetical protein
LPVLTVFRLPIMCATSATGWDKAFFAERKWPVVPGENPSVDTWGGDLGTTGVK